MSRTVSPCQGLLQLGHCHLLESSVLELTWSFGGSRMTMVLLALNPLHICCSSNTSFCVWCSFLCNQWDRIDPINLYSGKIQDTVSEQFWNFWYTTNIREYMHVSERYHEVDFLPPLRLPAVVGQPLATQFSAALLPSYGKKNWCWFSVLVSCQLACIQTQAAPTCSERSAWRELVPSRNDWKCILTYVSILILHFGESLLCDS